MRVCVVGANGFTGRRILAYLAKEGKYELLGCSLHSDSLGASSRDYRFLRLDINDFSSVKDLFGAFRPEVVINTSALSAPDYCETHREEAYATNVAAVEHLAQCCECFGSRLLHFSTDFVFDGNQRELYRETDVPSPLNYYGETKLLSERAVGNLCENHAIVRVVVVYGKSLPGQHGNIVQLVKTRLENHQEIRVVSDQWRTPTWVGDIARGVELLLPSAHQGIYHLCGGEYLSISEIAYRVADYFQLDRSLIHPVTTLEMNEATPRPHFSGLSIAKACQELGYLPSSLEQGMEELR